MRSASCSRISAAATTARAESHTGDRDASAAARATAAGALVGLLTPAAAAVTVAGLGCNVPAVLASRRCSSCVRRSTVAAIGFGSICSYQLAAAVALPVVLASVRKDGLLLLAAPAVLTTLKPAQLLAALVLAGTLTPCLVTMAAMARTVGWRATVPVLGRQLVVASGLTACLAWSGLLLG